MSAFVIKIDPKDFPRDIRRRLRTAPNAVKRGMSRSATLSRAYIVKQTPVDLGQLKNAWKVRRKPVIELYNTAPYGGVVEKGARPHPVSLAGQIAIYEWVRRHFYYTEWSGGKRSKPKKVRGGPFEDETLTAITMGIVNKIRTKGQKPTYFVRNSLPELRRLMVEEVVKAIKQHSRQRRPR